MSNKLEQKYILTTESKTVRTKNHGVLKLFRVKRLSDGLIGGWLEKEENLSQDGECFVFDEAQVCGNSKVSENAKACGDAFLCDSILADDTQVSGKVVLEGITLKDSAKLGGTITLSKPEGMEDNYTILDTSSRFEWRTSIQRRGRDSCNPCGGLQYRRIRVKLYFAN